MGAVSSLILPFTPGRVLFFVASFKRTAVKASQGSSSVAVGTLKQHYHHQYMNIFGLGQAK